jgi:hypothetical protein
MDDPVKLRARLAAGEWLTPGEVAVLTGAGRSTVHTWLASDPPKIRWRTKPYSRHRECHPQDVQQLVDELDRGVQAAEE